MGTNISKLNDTVLGNVRQSMGLEDDDDCKDDEIAAMSSVEVFERFLNWEGIIGYGRTIWEAAENIRSANSGSQQ